MKKCNYCGKTLEDDRFDYCDIDCRKVDRLSSEGERNIPIRVQDQSYNKENYDASSTRLKMHHEEVGHIACSRVS